MSSFDPKTYWENRLRRNFNALGVGDDGLGRRYNEWLYRVRRTVFLRQMRQLGLDFSRADVLDVGSGTGFYIERWRELGARTITGVDITETAVEQLSARHPDAAFLRLDIGSGDIAALGDRRFDAISAFDVLFHIVDDDRFNQAICTIFSLLKPGGLFIFSDNFLHGRTVRALDQVCRSLEAIEQQVRDAGFDILERTPMFVLMANPIDSTNPLSRLRWLATRVMISWGDWAGNLVGAGLYPVELAAVRLLRESPTTEMMVCRRPAE